MLDATPLRDRPIVPVVAVADVVMVPDARFVAVRVRDTYVPSISVYPTPDVTLSPITRELSERLLPEMLKMAVASAEPGEMTEAVSTQSADETQRRDIFTEFIPLNVIPDTEDSGRHRDKIRYVKQQ